MWNNVEECRGKVFASFDTCEWIIINDIILNLLFVCSVLYVVVMEFRGKFLLCLTRVNKSEMHSLNWLFPHHKPLFAQTLFHVGCRTTPFFISSSLPKSGPQILWLSGGWSWFVSAWQIHACLLVAWADASSVSPPRATSTWKLVLTRLGPPALTAGWWWHESYLNMLHLLSFIFVFSVWI